jgi:hypothetical protein
MRTWGASRPDTRNSPQCSRKINSSPKASSILLYVELEHSSKSCALLYSAFLPSQLHPAPRGQTFSLCNRAKLLEREIAKPLLEALQEPGTQAALDEKAGRRLPRARWQLWSSLHPHAPVMYFFDMLKVRREPSIVADPGDRKSFGAPVSLSYASISMDIHLEYTAKR